jgi:hypothetical protein
MRIIRDTNGELTNWVFNHVEVRPWVDDGNQPLDFRPLARDPSNWALTGGEPQILGAIPCVPIETGVFEFHMAVLKAGRGEWALDFALSATWFMFVHTHAIELLTRIPEPHKASSHLAMQAGFQPRWGRPSVRFRGRDVPYMVWGLSMMEWMPANEQQHFEIIEAMVAAGNKDKATGWMARWNFLSRETHGLWANVSGSSQRPN